LFLRLAHVIFGDEVAAFLNRNLAGVFEQGECLTCVAMLLSGQCSAEWNYFTFKYSLFEPYRRPILKDFAQLESVVWREDKLSVILELIDFVKDDDGDSPKIV
jgi:hypothetical protein